MYIFKPNKLLLKWVFSACCFDYFTKITSSTLEPEHWTALIDNCQRSSDVCDTFSHFVCQSVYHHDKVFSNYNTTDVKTSERLLHPCNRLSQFLLNNLIKLSRLVDWTSILIIWLISTFVTWMSYITYRYLPTD